MLRKIKDLNPVWFVRESWAFMEGSRWEFWTYLPMAYARYVYYTLFEEDECI